MTKRISFERMFGKEVTREDDTDFFDNVEFEI